VMIVEARIDAGAFYFVLKFVHVLEVARRVRDRTRDSEMDVRRSKVSLQCVGERPQDCIRRAGSTENGGRVSA
jgi:hypothetical protein